MPTVPTYNRQVQESALPNFRTNINTNLETFGGGQSLESLSSATRQLGDTAVKIGLEEKRAADEARVIGAFSELSNYKNKLQMEALNQKGENAFGLFDTHGKGFKDFNQKIEDSLSNDSQKAAFRKIRLKEETDFFDSLSRHVNTETNAVFDLKITDAIGASRQDTVLNYGKPGKVEEGIQKQQELVNIIADRKGLPQETRDKLLLEASSKTHDAVIKSMLANQQDIAAESYFKKYKDQISPEDQTVLQTRLEEGSRLGKAIRISDDIILNSKDRKEARNEYRKIEDDPKLREEVERRVELGFDRREKEAKDYSNQLFLEADKYLQQTGSLDGYPRTSDLTIPQLEALREQESMMVSGNVPKHEEPLYLEYKGMDYLKLADKSESEILMLKHRLSPKAYQDVTSRWSLAKNAKNGDSSALGNIKSIDSDEELIINSLKSLDSDLFPNTIRTPEDISKNSNRSKIYDKVRQEIDDKFIAYQYQNGGKPVPPDVKKKIIHDHLMQKVFVDEFGRDPEKPIAFLSKEDLKNAYIPVERIPERDQDYLIQILKDNQVVPPTMGIEEIKVKHRKRIEKAYAARAYGGKTKEEMINILVRE